MPFLWIPATVAAALLQALRTADQRLLVGKIGNNGANFARYAVGAPIALVGLLAVALVQPLPAPSVQFLLFCLSGGIAQILATALLLQAIRIGSFAVGTTFSKTEALLAALFSSLVLGEHLSATGWAAVALAFAGVILLSVRAGAIDRTTWWRDPAALAGLGSAALFAVSGVSIRAAALELGGGPALARAVMTLATTTSLQVVLMVLPMAVFRDRGLRGLLDARRLTLRVGLMSIAGSLGWFLAMTLAPVAYVRALGQVELVFTVLLAKFRFGEKLGAAELSGVALVGIGIVLLLLGL